MSNVFYKKNSKLFVASVASAQSISQILQPLGTSNITSGTSVYIGMRQPSRYPNMTYGSVVYKYATYSGSSAYCSANSTSIYSEYVEDAFNTLRGNATLFSADDLPLEFCDNNGQSLFTIDGNFATNGSYFDMSFNDTSWTGVQSGFVTQSAVNPVFNFFLVNFQDYGICLAMFYHADSVGTSAYNVNAAVTFANYNNNTKQTLLDAAFSSAVYGASGSSEGTSSGENGGGGIYSFDNSDISSADDMPSSSPAITAGLVNPYYVTASEIASLGNFLWSSDFFDSIAKTFSNPMDCIISLSSFPLASSSMSLGSSESVRVGNTTSSSTGTRLLSEFVTIDCGSVSVPEVWGSYLDYAQTKLYIYIPYLGIEELPLCECMGGTVACSLRINLLTGALVACVTLTSGTYVTGSARVQPIYFSTTCKSDIPVSGATTGALAGAFQLLGGAVSSVAGIATGVAPLAISGLASAAQGVATMQSQNSQISGAVGAAGGQMAHKIPFLIFDRPVQSVPANLASVAGYQSNSGTTLSKCSGYVICDTINLDGLALTRSELEEVEQICTSGVYIS